jgi:hypothetical protein
MKINKLLTQKTAHPFTHPDRVAAFRRSSSSHIRSHAETIGRELIGITGPHFLRAARRTVAVRKARETVERSTTWNRVQSIDPSCLFPLEPC